MTKEELREIKDSMIRVIYNSHTHMAIPYENWYKIIATLEEHLEK